MNLRKFKSEIDPLIDNYIQNKIYTLPNDKDFKFLKEQFEYIKVFIKDGKRIRPYITYITYLSFGGKRSKKIINTLVFIEIFHYFCLIHDDIMDNSVKRHGIKTINSKYGVSEAILLGDYLFFWAWEIIISVNLNTNQKKKFLSIFRDMVDDVLFGQTLDIYSNHKKIVSDEFIYKKTLHKTAGYTFTKPMLLGLSLADNLKDKNKKFCEDLGKNLGLAFQIQDDLLDIVSDFNGSKIPLKDVSEGNHTIFTNYVFKNGTDGQKRVLSDNFGKEKVDVEKVRKAFYDSGAIEYGKKTVYKYLNICKDLAIENKYYLELINQIERREK